MIKQIDVFEDETEVPVGGLVILRIGADTSPTPLETPIIISPLNESEDNPVSTPIEFIVPNQNQLIEEIQLQVATDDQFTTVVFDTGEITYVSNLVVVSPALIKNTVYYVRVKVNGDVTGWTDWSNVVQFKTIATVVNDVFNFTSSNPAWIVPATGTYLVESVGGGGGASGCNTECCPTASGNGGGGGSGSYTYSWTKGQSIVITIGAGGAGFTSASAGGTTTIAGNNHGGGGKAGTSGSVISGDTPYCGTPATNGAGGNAGVGGSAGSAGTNIAGGAPAGVLGSSYGRGGYTGSGNPAMNGLAGYARITFKG